MSSIPIVLTPQRFQDDRGWFSETYNLNRFDDLVGGDVRFVQDNHSFSQRSYTLRGLHFQRPPHPQAKLVMCLAGTIWDVAVDLRSGSPTYFQWTAAELSAEGGRQIFIPVGFAHGFISLTENAEVTYKCSDYYAPGFEDGLVWDDPTLAIDWPLGKGAPLLSPKDAALGGADDFISPFVYDGNPMVPLS
jgi:dTDP-4-dehydrorhamnose 3,5-epimerase